MDAQLQCARHVYHAAATLPRCPPASSHITLLSTLSAPLSSLLHILLLLFLTIYVSCSSNVSLSLPPPEQHHVYYSGSHVTSLAIQSSTGVVYATDVAHGRVTQYWIGGRFVDFWWNNGTAFVSPTSVGTALENSRPLNEWLLIGESTTRRVHFYLIRPVVAVERGGSSDGNETLPFTLPDEMWECGLIVTPNQQYTSAVFIVDRYRGYVARYDLTQSDKLRWQSQPPPPPAANNSSHLTALFLSSVTVTNDRVGVMYVLDSATDRVLRLNSSTGQYMSPLLLALPDDVSGIQAVSWTWCGWSYPDTDGCLWVMYQPDEWSESGRRVMAVSVLNGTVLYNWTTGAAGGERTERAAVAALSNRDSQLTQQQSSNNAHLASPAMLVTGSGTDLDPFRVHLAEADPDGAGHVIVERDETGALLQQYDSTPAPFLVDTTNHTMHAFTAVRVENTTCTLWLTDVDNGGLLIRTAADGTILQHYTTPALFTAVVVDYTTDPSSPTLVLLSINETDWQLWRFHPVNGSFVPLNTTSAHKAVDSSGSRGMQTGSCGITVDGSAIVTWLDVDVDSGRLLISLPCSDTVLMLNASGEWNDRFSTTGQVVRPTLAVFINRPKNIAVVDQSGEQGGWQFKAFHDDTAVLATNVSFTPPMSQPLALIWDESSQSLWMADTSGLIFQLQSVTFEVITTSQPLPAAYDVRGLSMDSARTMYAVDRTTRRLILLFVGADSAVQPSSTECHPYPIPSCSSTSGCSSSSTGTSGPPPDSDGGHLDGGGPLIGGVVGAAVVLILLVSLSTYYCVRRRRRSAGGEGGVELDEAQSGVYKQWLDGELDAAALSRQRAANNASALLCKTHPSASLDSVSPAFAISASDNRYDAYVRLYEALNDAQGDKRRWYEAAKGRLRGNTPQSISYRPSTMFSFSSSARSVAAAFQSTSRPSAAADSALHASDYGDSGSSVPAVAAGGLVSPLHSPSSIARLSSRISAMPRFIDEVTDLTILGEGQSGRVYSGYYAGVRVVVKLPKSREMSAAQWREWQAHLRLPTHPNLVRFIGSLVMSDTNYLVLQWVEQGSLKSLLSQPSATRTAHWYSRPYGVMRAAADVAAALHHIHRQRLVHRDVSARNVLVDRDGTFVLADLGLCQEEDSDMSPSSSASTQPVPPTTIPLRWCSPDYLQTWRCTDKCDVWSLGVTLWECASGGRLPYSEIADNTGCSSNWRQVG